MCTNKLFHLDNMEQAGTQTKDYVCLETDNGREHEHKQGQLDIFGELDMRTYHSILHFHFGGSMDIPSAD